MTRMVHWAPIEPARREGPHQLRCGVLPHRSESGPEAHDLRAIISALVGYVPEEGIFIRGSKGFENTKRPCYGLWTVLSQVFIGVDLEGVIPRGDFGRSGRKRDDGGELQGSPFPTRYHYSWACAGM